MQIMIEIFESPITDLGFEIEINSQNNYPEYYQKPNDLFQEWRMQQEVLFDNGN